MGKKNQIFDVAVHRVCYQAVAATGVWINKWTSSPKPQTKMILILWLYNLWDKCPYIIHPKVSYVIQI